MIKRLIVPLSVALFLITGGICGWYYYIRSSTIPAYQKKLSTMVHNRADEISAYLTAQENYALTLSQEPIIIDALQKNIDENAQRQLSELINSQKETMNFESILLIDRNGIILFSSTQQNLVGIDINKHTNSSLGKSYERAKMTLTTDFSHFSFNELLQKPAFFITIPILKEKKFIGTLTYQLDEEKIYLITNQYIDLDKTGETVIAKKEGEYIVFLSPTRNDPDLAFKKRALFTHQTLAIEPSVLGQQGSGVATDYREQKVVGAWQFIPKLDWGIITKIDYDELLQPTLIIYKLFLFFLLLFALSLLCTTYAHWSFIHRKIVRIRSLPLFKKIPAIMKNPLFILLVVIVGLTIKNIVRCERKKAYAIEKAKKQAVETISKNAETIESILTKIAFIGQSIADDLRTNYLKKDDIATRIKRDLIEDSIVTGITVLFAYDNDGTAALHMQTIARTGTDSQDIVASQSGPDAVETINIQKTKWYREALEKGKTWIVNTTQDAPDSHSKHNPTATYARTLVDKENKPYGAIAITFLLNTIIHTTEYSGIGQTGYSIILSENGSFIFHPTSSIVHEGTTLLRFAQSAGNEELATVAEKVIKGNPVMASYASESGKEIFWIYTQPIKINGWIIGSLFSQDEVGLQSHTIRHYYFWILVWLTIALLLLCALLCSYAIISLTDYAVIANCILIIGLIFIWHTIKITTTLDREARTIITDQSNLNKFLNDVHDEAERKHEAPPITIPCGLLLSSISLPDPDHISISGYAWNKYNNEQKDISREMKFPQASKIIFGSPTISVSDHEETATWNIQAILFQEQNYTKYPFDQEQIRIILDHKDIEKNTILTPDLVSYKKISPESMPGLDKEFSLPGFTIEQTFFEYHKVEPTTNFGLQTFGKVTDNYQLVYNAILNRNLLNPFVLYLLPLLVILFSLFSTLLVEGVKSEPLSILGGYTGLFFALIVLQRALREQHPTGSTLYLEYAFFYTYITIILLIIHTILMYYYKSWESYQNKSLYLMRILFWPFQLISWLITTLIVFY